MLSAHFFNGLGNQLFIYHSASYFAKKWNKQFVYDKSQFGKNPHENVDITKLFNHNIVSNIKYDKRIEYKVTHDWKTNLDSMETPKGNVLLIGLYQTFWDNHITIPKLIQVNNDYSNTCFIHHRRGDFLKKKHQQINLDTYYTRCIETVLSLKSDIQFIIFSDDCKYYKKQYANMNNCTVSEANTNDSLYIMSKCQYGICGNSTFGLWGCYLAKMQNKQFVCYVPHMLQRTLSEHNARITNNIYAPWMTRVFSSIPKIYTEVISLERHHERYEMFCQSNADVLHDFFKFVACDGYAHNAYTTEEVCVKPKTNKERGILGLKVSYLRLCKKYVNILDDTSYLLILEDDALLNKDFWPRLYQAMASDNTWNCLYADYQHFFGKDHNSLLRKPKQMTPKKPKINTLTTAMIINKAFCKYVIDTFGTIDNCTPLDKFLRHRFWDSHTYFMRHKIAHQNQFMKNPAMRSIVYDKHLSNNNQLDCMEKLFLIKEHFDQNEKNALFADLKVKEDYNSICANFEKHLPTKIPSLSHADIHVVGNGDIIGDYGESISASNNVIRFGLGKIKDYETKVGDHTNLHVMTLLRFDKLKGNQGNKLLIDSSAYAKMYVRYSDYLPESRDLYILRPSVHKQLKKNVKTGHYMSTGFMFIKLLLTYNFPHKIHVYGFAGNTHYCDPKHKMFTAHNINHEHEELKRLHEEKKIIMYE